MTASINTHSIKLGDILYSTWGYDQTNVSFFEVVKVTRSTVSIRELKASISENGFMSGVSVPCKNNYHSNEILVRRVRSSGSVRVWSFATAFLWDGDPVRCSWYA
jgi:hypothetical protein